MQHIWITNLFWTFSLSNSKLVDGLFETVIIRCCECGVDAGFDTNWGTSDLMAVRNMQNIYQKPIWIASMRKYWEESVRNCSKINSKNYLFSVGCFCVCTITAGDLNTFLSDKVLSDDGALFGTSRLCASFDEFSCLKVWTNTFK